MRERKSYSLDQSPLYKLTRKRRLAEIVGIEQAELRFLSKNADSLYNEFDLPKKSGGVRRVENPRRQLKIVQARLARLLSRIAAPDYLFCPVRGRSYVSNAAAHRGNRVIRCLDIKKYFPSTPSTRIFWFFRSIMKCSLDVAAILAALASYRGHLPTGSPLSPIMSYFAFYDLWSEVARICRSSGCTLTVYVDDVTVSGQSVPLNVMWGIRRQIHRVGLRYHKEKFYVDTPAEITGVIVKGGAIFPPNRQLKKMHELKQASMKSDIDADGGKIKASMSGLSGQIKQIDDFS